MPNLKTELPEGNFEKLRAFLDQLPLPSSVVDGISGKLIYLNRNLFEFIKNDFSDIPYKCPWKNSKEGRGCSDSSDVPTIDGRCFIPKELNDQLTLVIALRLKEYGSALIRVYSHPDQINKDIVNHNISKVLAFADIPALLPSYVAGSSRYGLSSTYLKKLIDEVISVEGLSKNVTNFIPSDIIASKIEPLSIYRLSSAIIAELNRLNPDTRKLISYNSITLSDVEGHNILYSVSMSELNTKSKTSEIGAIEIRLQRLLKQMVDLTRFHIESIEIQTSSNEISISLKFPDIWSEEKMKTNSMHPPRSWDLSPREEEIVEMISSGYSNQDVAFALGIKTATVKQHLKAIYRKANTKSRTALVFSRNIPVVSLSPERDH